MSTSLGLYGGPKSAYTSVLTAFSITWPINIEVDDGTPFTGDVAPINIEVRDSVAFSGTALVNLEVSDPFNTAGTPDAILNLPTYTISPRIRADFYEWSVVFTGKMRAREDIGAKVGSAPLVSGQNFEYSSRLSAAGEWSITVALPDTQASVIFDGTAKIIKVYMENVGQIFTGWITGYQVNEEGTVTINGYDLGYELMTGSPLWRRKIVRPGTSYNRQIVKETGRGFWWIVYSGVFGAGQLIDNGYFWRRYWESGVMPPSPPSRTSPLYQVDMEINTESETWMEVLRNLEEITGCPFRFHPITGVPTIGLLGELTDFVLAPVQEDDPFAREDGALVLKDISYSVDLDNLCNMVVPQGSNDSYGIAVELRHAQSDGYRRHRIGWDLREVSDETINANGYVILNSGYAMTATLQSVPDPSSNAESALNLNQAGGAVALAGAIAVEVRVTQDMYFTYAAARNWGGAGAFHVSFVQAASPPTNRTTLIRNLCNTNYPVGASSGGLLGILPGHVVATYPNEAESTGNTTKDEAGRTIDEITGSFTEILAFPQISEQDLIDTNGTPLKKVAANTTYWLIFWSPDTFSNWGFPPPAQDRSPRLGVLRGMNHIATRIYRPTLGWIPFQHDLFCEISLWNPNNGRWNYAIEGFPAININENGAGSRVFFMRNFDSIFEYGYRQKVVSFPQANDAEAGEKSIVPMSNQLHQAASVYLDRHSAPAEHIQVTVTGAFRLPWVGNRVKLFYRGLVRTENGTYIWKDFNDYYYVTDIRWSISEAGIEHTFSLSNFPVSQDVGYGGEGGDLYRFANRTRNHLGELKTGANRLGRFQTASANSSSTTGIIAVAP